MLLNALVKPRMSVNKVAACRVSPYPAWSTDSERVIFCSNTYIKKTTPDLWLRWFVLLLGKASFGHAGVLMPKQ